MRPSQGATMVPCWCQSIQNTNDSTVQLPLLFIVLEASPIVEERSEFISLMERPLGRMQKLGAKVAP